MKRLNWNEYFMQLTEMVAVRSTCDVISVGCIITNEKRIIATGYCGAPRGMPHCTEVGCKIVKNHCIRTLHAELNAILQCVEHGVSTKNAVVYLTHSPCWHCGLMLINARVKKIYYKKEYKDDRGDIISLLKDNGIAVIKL